MKTAAALLAAVAIAALTLLPSTPALTAGHRIQINEIYYNSPGPDTGSNSSLNAEWVRLYNTSSSKISLTNWTLRDAAGHVFKFAAYTLGAHSYVKIHTGHGTRTETNRYWNRQLVHLEQHRRHRDTARLQRRDGGLLPLHRHVRRVRLLLTSSGRHLLGTCGLTSDFTWNTRQFSVRIHCCATVMTCCLGVHFMVGTDLDVPRPEAVWSAFE